MLKIGDRVKVNARVGGPDIAPRQARFRLQLWGLEGTVVDVCLYLDRPIVVAFSDVSVPARVRFWTKDLSLISGARTGQ